MCFLNCHLFKEALSGLSLFSSVMLSTTSPGPHFYLIFLGNTYRLLNYTVNLLCFFTVVALAYEFCETQDSFSADKSARTLPGTNKELNKYLLNE